MLSLDDFDSCGALWSGGSILVFEKYVFLGIILHTYLLPPYTLDTNLYLKYFIFINHIIFKIRWNKFIKIELRLKRKNALLIFFIYYVPHFSVISKRLLKCIIINYIYILNNIWSLLFINCYAIKTYFRLTYLPLK